MAKVQIYGEIVPFQDEWIIENGYCNLSHVNKQLEAAAGEDLEIGINCIGGDVEEGFAIYSSIRRYAKENDAKVATRADGRCASIATVILLSGDTRIGSKYVEPFVHNAWAFVFEGDSKTLKRLSDDLEATNEKIAKFYAEHTNLTYDEARELMDNETFISSQEALDIRFYTEIEEVMRPAALQRFTSNSRTKNKKQMSKKDTEKGLLEQIKALFKNEGLKNLEVFTSTNESLVFPDLEEGQEPAVGDKAEIGGKAAEGRITLQDGTTYVFVAGELTEIIPSEDEEDDDDAMAALKQENAELKAQLEAQNKKIEGIEAKQQESEKQWSGLKALVSNYKVEDEDEEDKSRPKKTDKRRTLADVAKDLGGKK